MKEHNIPQALDLYSKVEDLLGVKEASPLLYKYYYDLLKNIDFTSLLDIGCGDGTFLHELSGYFPAVAVSGIDMSMEMVSKARLQGLDVECCGAESCSGCYDVITAVFDMLNYISPDDLAGFLSDVCRLLTDGGFFLCDINTVYGFEEVAVGSFSAGDENRFISIESDYTGGVYSSRFVLFERTNGECWRKSSQNIFQYHHNSNRIEQISELKLLKKEMISLYADEPDKEFLVFVKSD